jgi:hypothetical protein
MHLAFESYEEAHATVPVAAVRLDGDKLSVISESGEETAIASYNGAGWRLNDGFADAYNAKDFHIDLSLEGDDDLLELRDGRYGSPFASLPSLLLDTSTQGIKLFEVLPEAVASWSDGDPVWRTADGEEIGPMLLIAPSAYFASDLSVLDTASLGPRSRLSPLATRS